MGQEWVMIPIHKDSILPNLFERPGTEEIFYLDGITEPYPGIDRTLQPAPLWNIQGLYHRTLHS